MSDRRLLERRAIVAGAAGGIGSAIASAFVREGARVAAIGRNEEALVELCSTLSRTKAYAVAADIADADEVDAAVRRAAHLLGGLDIVVNAAAVDAERRPVGELSVASWRETVATNLNGAFYLCRAALPLLVAAGGGSIVNVTSVAGLRASPLDSAYGVSKAGVEMLTRTIAAEYGSHRVRANCIAPGVVDAGRTDAVTDPDERDRLVALHPLGRMGSPEEVAEAAVWLCSGGSFTTGWTLAVDGGLLAGR